MHMSELNKMQDQGTEKQIIKMWELLTKQVLYNFGWVFRTETLKVQFK